MGTTEELSRQDIAKKERKLDHLYEELQEERLKIDRKREKIEAKRKAFREMLQEEYEIATSILRRQEQDVSFEWQSLNQYLESYDVVAEEASQEELKKLDLQDEELVDSFSKERRHLEWEIEDDYRRLRQSE